MSGTIEQELTKTVKFKAPKGGFKDRQDELAALAKAVVKLSDDDFDELSNEAADWVNNAIKAINAKDTIKDFGDDNNDAEDEAEAEELEDEADAEDEDEAEDEEVEDEAPEDEIDHEAEEAAEAAKAEKNKKAAKPKPPAKAAKATKPEEQEKAAPEKSTKNRYEDLTGEKDRFGVIIGTKTHDAVLMYEKGATSKQIQDALGEGPEKKGGRFYNVLRRLSEEGHLVERSADGVFTLTHRDDLDNDKKPTKPRKTKQTRIGAR